MTSGAVGLVLARPARMLGLEAFFMELVAGIEETLAATDMSLLLHVVPDHTAELAAWRRWAAGHLVDALVVVDYLGADDERLAALPGLGLPAVVLGGPATGLPVTNVFVDDDAGAREAVAALHGLGHTRIARVSGPDRLLHTRVRTASFADECAVRGMEITTVEADYTEQAGRRATRDLLRGPTPPTAVVYDNDVMAAAGLAVAAEEGLLVPEQLSVVAWDDSPLCRLASPAISVVAIDVHALGMQAGECVLAAVAGAPPATLHAQPPRLTLRGTTAAPLPRHTSGVS